MDLPVAPLAMIELLRGWFFAKDRSIVLAADTCLISDDFLCFQTDVPHTEKVRITADGNVGIGTISPEYLLDTSGNARIGNGATGVTTLIIDSLTANNSSLEFHKSNILNWRTFAHGATGDFRINRYDTLGVFQSNPFTVVQSNGFVGINRNIPVAQFHIDQSSTTAAIPALIVDQADTSEGTINFVASARGTGSTAAGDIQDTVRVELNGTVYRLALYTDA